MRLAVKGGSFAARSPIAAATRSVNYFAEINSPDALVPLTLYQRPGMRALTAPPVIPAPVRGLYRASNGQGYAVIGSDVYAVQGDWSLSLLGSITPGLVSLVRFADNGIDVVLVDGSPNGWTINMTTGAFATIADGTGTFQGADWVQYIDSFLIFNSPPGSRQFISTLSNSVTFNALFVASKTSYADPLSAILVNWHLIYLLGTLKSEVWFDAGGAQFPFQQMTWAYIEHGVAAKYSVAQADIAIYWLGQDLQGHGIVFRQKGYTTERISNHGLEVALRELSDSGLGINDAIGYTYQQDGHSFYVLTFPNGDQTWVFDEAVGDPKLAWHQRAWTDSSGALHRDRSNCYAFINGTCVVGDWQNGTLYALDTNYFADQVNGVETPISCIRTLGRIGAGHMLSPAGQLVESDGKRQMHYRFVLDMESGTTQLNDEAMVSLRVSDDRGRTWGDAILVSAGSLGDYTVWPSIPGPLGQTRDRLYEISHSIRGPAALNGYWLDPIIAES